MFLSPSSAPGTSLLEEMVLAYMCHFLLASGAF